MCGVVLPALLGVGWCVMLWFFAGFIVYAMLLALVACMVTLSIWLCFKGGWFDSATDEVDATSTSTSESGSGSGDASSDGSSSTNKHGQSGTEPTGTRLNTLTPRKATTAHYQANQPITESATTRRLYGKMRPERFTLHPDDQANFPDR